MAGNNSTEIITQDDNLRKLLTNENITNLAIRFPGGNRTSSEDLRYNISALHEAGVPILAGTDAPNPGSVHGASLHHELRLLVEAGLTPAEALAASTSVPAKQFKLADRGRVAVGRRADLLLVEGDPAADIRHLADIAGVWKAGVAIDRSKRMEVVAAEIERAKNPLPPSEVDGLVSDFETDGGEKMIASFGAGWSVSTDSIMGGTSTAKLTWQEGGAADSKGSMRIAGDCRKQQPTFAGALFSPGETPMSPKDLSSHKGISFWAKGSGSKFVVLLFSQKRGFVPSAKTFAAKDDWKQCSFPISDFDGCDGTDITGLWFGSNQPGEFEFQIDRVELTK